MSSGISTHGNRGLPATGAVRWVTTCAVRGSSETPPRFSNSGIHRPPSIAIGARRTGPATLVAIILKDVHAMADICHEWTIKPNVGRARATLSTGTTGTGVA